MLRTTLLFCAFFFSISQVMAQNVALDLDGSNDYVQTNYSGISGTGARTIEAWIKTTANTIPANGGQQQIITDWGTFSTGQRFTFNVLYNGAIRIEIQGNGLSGNEDVTDGNWHYVAVVYDPSASNKYRLLVDGHVDTIGNISVSQNTGNSVKLNIGRRIDGSRFFDGSIDEVRVYDYAKSDSAVAADMNKQFCSFPSGLKAYYRLNDGTANSNNTGNNTASCEITGANNGVLNNFSLSGNSSNWVSGPSLSGGDSYATVDTVNCSAYTAPSGNTYSFTGTYTDVINNAAGCDSIITVNLTIGRTFTVIRPSACDSFISPKGNTIRQSGVYRDTFFNGNRYGCDSIIYMEVTINESKHTYDTMYFCDSAIVNSYIFYQDVDLNLFSTAANGCDSTHHLRLEINASTQGEIDTSVCDVYISPSQQQWTQTGVYYDTLRFANSSGCDSVIRIDLEVRNSYQHTVDTSVCDSFITPLEMEVIRQSRVVTANYNAVNGCDSMVVYNVTIHASKEVNISFIACDSALINGVWYDSSQLVDVYSLSSTGCDSLTHVNLMVVKINKDVMAYGDSLVCEETNADSYTWYDCSTNKAIIGANGRVYKTGKSGDFKVVMIKGNCSFESNCVNVEQTLRTIELSEAGVDVYPNPSHGELTISSNSAIIEHVQVSSLDGKLIYDLPEHATQKLEISGLQSGVYLLQIKTNIGLITLKHVVQ